MATPGMLGSLVPPGEDAAVRKMADLQRELRELGPSVAASFASTVAMLQEQQDAIAAQTAYLASLQTKSAIAPNFTINPIPGDGVDRFVDSTAVVYLAVPTGRALVTVGAELVVVRPGDSSGEIGVTYNITEEGGSVPWYPSGTRRARVFSTFGDSDSHSVSVTRPVAVSTIGVSKFVMAFSSVATSLTTPADGNVFAPYMIVQVIPADV